MEPDVIRMYSSSPPPMEDCVEEEDEFGDFGGFSGLANSVSFSDFDTPAAFNQAQALTATSPPELVNGRVAAGLSKLSSAHCPPEETSRANGVVPQGCNGSATDTTARETKAAPGDTPDVAGSTQDGAPPRECNGGCDEALSNGLATCAVQGSPALPVHLRKHITSAADAAGSHGSPEDGFADFDSFCHSEARGSQGAPVCQGADTGQGLASQESSCQEQCIDQLKASQHHVRDAHRTECQCAHEVPGLPGEPAGARTSITHLPNGLPADNWEDTDLSPPPDTVPDVEEPQLDRKGSETEMSPGRPPSTEALEEFGDMSTTGLVPSPPFQDDGNLHTDHSQAMDDQDFGDFGDAGSISGQDFQEHSPSDSSTLAQVDDGVAAADNHDDDFGDFDVPQFHDGEVQGQEGGGRPADFPGSDSFGNFSSAVVESQVDAAGWSAFEQPEPGQVEGESWAAFSEDRECAPPPGNEEEEEEEWHQVTPVSAPPATSSQSSRAESHSAELWSRLERLFQHCFPEASVTQVSEDVLPLKVLLEPPEERSQDDEKSAANQPVRNNVWRQLQDIHEAFGLRHQWGGSHSNKTLLCSLGIDIRNILFTGQKKQPVIVPMYAASLGMLEPTKEPVKPISAAEMIASIAQAPAVGPEKSPCSTDTAQQEALPPVQFDWSSSGLTNPLDASGGSSLLNLDFFGPVEDSGCATAPSIPGVDPELYELTTAKLDPGGSGSRVADAFARLMSTMEKTSTSTRKPRKEENLSEEAAKVISALPDLSFMQAKVLMFPTTLTPLGCSQALSE